MIEQRKLAAVMFTDIVGYTTLMSQDEQKALALLKKNRELQKALVEKHNGEFLKEMGDGTLLCFQSALDAVRCAIEIQESVKDDPDLNLRIGIHLGDIVFKDGDVFGDGVNVASRIEKLAESRGICISGQIYKTIRNKPGIDIVLLGEKRLKNVEDPVTIYALTGEGLSEPQIKSFQDDGAKKPGKKWIIVLAGILVLTVLIIGIVWISSREEKSSQSELQIPRQSNTKTKSIVVLPFKNISPDPDQEYFSDGLTDEVITDLSFIDDLLVISFSSAMTLKGTKKTIPEIAQSLNVRYVLEASVRKAGSNLRITARLIDARIDAQLWADKYSGTLDDVFEIQTKVSQAIVDALKMQLTSEEENQIATRSTDNVQAYDCWIRARYDLSLYTKVAVERAINNLQNALDVFDENPLLYAGMGWAYFTYVNAGLGGENHIDKAVQYVQKAVVLDPDIPQGHYVMGAINGQFYGNQQLSIEHYERALMVDPNNSKTMYWLGATFLTVGKMLEVDQLAKKISQVDPLSSSAAELIGNSNLLNGHYKRALKSWERAIQLTPEHPYDEFMLATTLSYLKRYEEAITLINKSAKTSPDSRFTKMGILLKLALQGKNSEMFHTISQEIEIWARRGPRASWMMAERYSLIEENDKALDWLENAVDRGWINYPHLSEHSPFLDNIRGEERFKKLMERVKHEWENFEV